MKNTDDRIARLERQLQIMLEEVQSIRKEQENQTELPQTALPQEPTTKQEEIITAEADTFESPLPENQPEKSASYIDTAELDVHFQAKDKPRREAIAPEESYLSNLKRSEFWFNKIGIGLLLLGIGFLFKYSVDQGWLIPAVRIAMGAGVSIALLVTGIRMLDSRPQFAEVLAGGGVAGLYLSIYASFQWYELLAYPPALMAMIVVSVIAFVLSLRTNQQGLSVIAAIGALGTPFFLYSDSGSVWGLVLYTTAVLVVTWGVFWKKLWWPIYWIGIVGGWLILVYMVLESTMTSEIKSAAMFGMTAFLILHWPGTIFPLISRSEELKDRENISTNLVPAFSLVLLSMGMIITGTWELTLNQSGYVYLGLSAMMLLPAVIWRFVIDQNSDMVGRISFSQIIAGVLAANVGLGIVLSEDQMYVALMAQTMILLMLPVVQSNSYGRLISYVLCIVLSIATITRLTAGVNHTIPGWHPAGIANLMGIFAVFGVSLTTVYTKSRKYWASGGHLLIFMWVLREFDVLESGQAYITIIWALYAISVLIYSMQGRDRYNLVTSGIMLIVVLAKLFVFDLSRLEPLWRIAIFMGFGMLFLVLSYRLQNYWRKE